MDTLRRLRDWLDPIRLYDPRNPAGRLVFLWGLLVYPLIFMTVLMTVLIILVESASPGADVSTNLGLLTWGFMLLWVTAAICICFRRLRDLGMRQAWAWLAIWPVVNLVLFIYLLLKRGSD